MSSTIILSRPLGPNELLMMFAMACVAWTVGEGRILADWELLGRRGATNHFDRGYRCRKSSGPRGTGCRPGAGQRGSPFSGCAGVARLRRGRDGRVGGECCDGSLSGYEVLELSARSDELFR